jgi:glycosyltransferase involved in cell wall biosynthesis
MVVSEAPPVVSGISRVAAQLQQGIRYLGHHVDVISANDVSRYMMGEIRISSMLWKAPQLLLPILDAYDIVHIHGPVPTFSDIALLVSAIKKGSKGPIVAYTHHSEIDLEGYRVLCDVYNWIHKHLARLADQVIVTTPTYARNLGRYIPPEHISVVPWGVDATWYDEREPKADRFTALFVGQMRPYKGIETLLGAASRVQGIDFQIVGGGHLEAHYRELADRRGLDNVTFVGKLQDRALFDTFARAHAIILPSTTRAEAFGLVLLEGMVAGCVPLVSQLPGVTDVVGDAGFSFPVGDEAALASLLAELRDSESLRSEFSQRARARSRLYTWDRTVFWNLALYERLIALQRFGTALQSDGVQNQALETLLQDSVSTLNASSGSIMLANQRDRTLAIHAASGLPRSVIESHPQPFGQGIAGFVAEHHMPLLLAEGHTDLNGRELAVELLRPHIYSSLSVPIRSGKQMLGVMNLANYIGGRRFGRDDLDWLDTLGRRAGRILSGQS